MGQGALLSGSKIRWHPGQAGMGRVLVWKEMIHWSSIQLRVSLANMCLMQRAAHVQRCTQLGL